MVDEPGKNKIKNDTDKTSGGIFINEKKNVDLLSFAALLSLIISILLISFDKYLLAGCLIIAGACIGVILYRKTSSLLKRMEEMISNYSLLNQKKDDVIKDFSRKIRGPLNNLVIIVDWINESGLGNDQKELIDSVIVSTNNMVSTVNELTMQSAGNLTYELRKAIRI